MRLAFSRLALCLSVLPWALPAQAASAQVAPADAVETVVRSLASSVGDAHDRRLATFVARFYAGRQFAPAWTDARGYTPAGQALQQALATADAEGLAGDAYPVLPLAAPGETPSDMTTRARADVHLSFVALRFAEDLGWGLTLPGEEHRDNAYVRRPFPGDSLLRAWREAPDAGQALRAVAPGTPGYVRLREALQSLRAIARAGGWPAMSRGPTLRVGMTGARVVELRRALRAHGDLAAADSSVQREGRHIGPDRERDAQARLAQARATPDTFDIPLAAALARFQTRHGLAADSVLGAATVAALTVPVTTRLEQVRLGMERARWLPPVAGDRWITVNLADYRAFVFHDGVRVFDTRVVIGAVNHKTPMFTDTLTHIVLNPAWNVPTSIAVQEILPKLRRDPQYLVRNHMVRIGRDIQQLPGPWNALGQVAFMFPNRFSVYMHDTPTKALFESPDRAHSHGCIRVQRPHELATLLLAPEGWTRARLDSVIATGARTEVWLATPVPVRITYATAFIDSGGTLQFRRDIYLRDQRLTAVMQREHSRPLPRLTN